MLLMAAAVADFTPAAPATARSRRPSRARLELELEPTADVLAGLAARAARRPDAGRLRRRARRAGVDDARGKLAAKGLDAIVVNDISRGTSASTRTRTRSRSSAPRERSDGAQTEQRHVPRATKTHRRGPILDAVESLRASG